MTNIQHKEKISFHSLKFTLENGERSLKNSSGIFKCNQVFFQKNSLAALFRKEGLTRKGKRSIKGMMKLQYNHHDALDVMNQSFLQFLLNLV